MPGLKMHAGRMLGKLLHAVHSLYQITADFVYPPCCLSCKRCLEHGNALICQPCWDALPRLSSPMALMSEGILPLDPPFWFVSSLALYSYNQKSQHLIHLYKYRGYRRLGEQLGRRLGELYTECRAFETVHALVPVPLHPVRLRERGYNQSEILARAISRSTGLPVWSNVLRRLRYTRPQVKMSQGERMRNVADAFAATHSRRMHGACLLLVDDVLTTGSTMNECARTLSQAGASRVDCMTVVRVEALRRDNS